MNELDYAPVLDGLIEKAIALGATAADASIGRGQGVEVSVRAGKLETIEREETLGVSLRCLVGQRQSHVSGSDLSPEGLDAMLERCVAMAKNAPEDPYCGIPDLSELESTPRDLVLLGDDPVEPTVLEDEARAAEAAALAIDGIKDVPGSSAGWTVSEGWVAASNGFRAYRQDSVSGIGLSAIAERDGAMERDYDGWTTRRRVDRPSPEEIGRSAGERTIARLGSTKIESQKSAVLYDRRVASGLIGAFISAIAGPAIARGTSFLKHKLNEKVFADGIDIIDDPFMDYGLGTRAFDGEGRPVSVKKLIDDGVLTQWLLNGPSARQLGLTPNGFSSSGFGDPPGVSTSNLHVSPGSQTPDELIRQAGKALQVTEMFGPSINPNTGDYSVGVSGRWHDGNGNRVPVSEITIADNLVDMFARLIPANDLQFRGRMNAPSLLVEGMTIAGR